MNQADKYIADAVLGIDTLWGGDVMSPSGTGRFIADSWFSDFPLPEAYTHPAAAKLREAGGVSVKNREAVEEYLRAIDLPQAIAGVRAGSGQDGGAAQGLSDWNGGLPGCDVGAGHGGGRQGRCGALCALRVCGDGRAAGTLAAGEEARAGGGVAGTRRVRRANCWRQWMRGGGSA